VRKLLAEVKVHLFAANMFVLWKNSTLAQEVAVIYCFVLDLKTKGQSINGTLSLWNKVGC